MKALALALALAACTSPPATNAPDRLEFRETAKRACIAKGEVIVEEGRASAEPCEKTTAKLQEHAHTDQDCLVYFGDAGVTVTDICQ